MRKNAIRAVLFSMVSIAGIPAIAQMESEKNDLILVEELPADLRGLVHARVGEYLRLNPHLIDQASIVALDAKGTIYVLDREMSKVAVLGNPSCVVSGRSGQQ
jgi:hypothetical protein